MNNRFLSAGISYIIFSLLPWAITSANQPEKGLRQRFNYTPQNPVFANTINPNQTSNRIDNVYLFWLIAVVLITFIIITICVLCAMTGILFTRCLKYRKETLYLINNKRTAYMGETAAAAEA